MENNTPSPQPEEPAWEDQPHLPFVDGPTAKPGEHTPGPWSIGKLRQGSIEIQTPQGAIAELNTGCDDYPAILPVNVEADARLIAAAPDLLEACQKARIELIDQVSVMDDVDPMGAGANQTIEVCEAVIARATGKSP